VDLLTSLARQEVDIIAAAIPPTPPPPPEHPRSAASANVSDFGAFLLASGLVIVGPIAIVWLVVTALRRKPFRSVSIVSSLGGALAGAGLLVLVVGFRLDVPDAPAPKPPVTIVASETSALM
jgi:hypothetical protein